VLHLVVVEEAFVREEALVELSGGEPTVAASNLKDLALREVATGDFMDTVKRNVFA
tara:strand:+ start:374 stop:541 length:168 start_codon:yes stop_codon:yes gene_type:complete